MSKTVVGVTELEDRDPNTISQHVQVSWEDIIGEPDSFRSPERAWRLSSTCFNSTKNCCYIFLAVICSPLVACCTGCLFACHAFQQIWCVNPGLRLWKISCRSMRLFVSACSEAIIVPLAESLSYFWSGIKVKTQVLPEGPDRKEDILLI